MKNYRYWPLLFWTSLAAMALFLFFSWKAIIWQNTWINWRTLRLLAISSLVTSAALFSWLWFKNHIKVKTLRSGLLVFSGLLLFIPGILCLPLHTVIYLTADRESHYTATTRWVSGGRNSCSGLEVWDAELKQKITICNYDSYAERPEKVIIYKRSNGFGMVISEAWAY